MPKKSGLKKSRADLNDLRLGILAKMQNMPIAEGLEDPSYVDAFVKSARYPMTNVPLTFGDTYEHPADLLDEMEAESGVRDLPIVCGYSVLVKIWIRPEKSAGGIVYADITRDEDKYQSSVGKVMGMGPQAYTGTLADGSPRFPEGPWCKLRDWVLVPRYNGPYATFAGLPFLTIPDDRVIWVVKDPAHPHMRPRQLR